MKTLSAYEVGEELAAQSQSNVEDKKNTFVKEDTELEFVDDMVCVMAPDVHIICQWVVNLVSDYIQCKGVPICNYKLCVLVNTQYCNRPFQQLRHNYVELGEAEGPLASY